MKITTAASFLAGFYLGLVVWWIAIAYFQIRYQPVNLAFAFAYGLIPLLGGYFGLREARSWGMFGSALGKSLFFLSLGLITWGLGEMIWSYYNIVLGVEVPYPSWADASFILSWPLWSIGIFFLSMATGAKFGLKKLSGQLQVIIFPILIAALSYYLLIIVARQGSFEVAGGPLKIFFDLAYPMWDVIILTFAFIVYGLSFKYLGGRFKWPVIITLLGFVVNYFADFGFSYTTTIGTHYNGNWVDLLFTTAMFTLSFGINSFSLKEE